MSASFSLYLRAKSKALDELVVAEVAVAAVASNHFFIS